MVEMSAETLLQADLSCFSDPGTPIGLQTEEDAVMASWQEDGVRRVARFWLGEGGPEYAQYEDSERLSYRDFLAGEDMGNLRQLARNSRSVVSDPPGFMTSRATLVADDVRTGDASSLVREAAAHSADSAIVTFVSADAGVGKTSLLKHLARSQSEAYLRGEADSLWIYVDAQARRLAALEEALASEIDRLRARFPFDAVLPLVRCGAITLVVDGFDELIGSVGAYDEAFNSLADFISNLSGQGSLVISARSAYYEQEFLSRVSRGLAQQSSWTLRPVRLAGWNADERSRYVERQAVEAGLSQQVAKACSARVEDLLGQEDLERVADKPFFVVRTAELVVGEALGDQYELDLGSSQSLLDRLVEAYISRDVGKLLTPARSEMLDPAGLRLFFDEIAIEMWRQESRELSRTSVKEVAQVVGEFLALDEDAIAEIATRAPYFAMFRAGSLQGGVGWEHDVFFAYFISGPIAVDLAGNHLQLSRLLRRGRLPQDAARMVGRRLENIDVERVLTTLSRTTEVEAIEAARVRRNAGLLAAGVLYGRGHHGISLRGALVGDVDLGSATFTMCNLTDSRFEGTDLSRTQFLDCTADSRTTFVHVIVDPAVTRLEVGGLSEHQFFGLGVRTSDDAIDLLFEPAKVLTALRDSGLPGEEISVQLRSIPNESLKLLRQVAWYFQRSNIVVEGGDRDHLRFLNHPGWPALRTALIASGCLERTTMSASGQKAFYRRTVSGDDLLVGLDPDAQVPTEVTEFFKLLDPH